MLQNSHTRSNIIVTIILLVFPSTLYADNFFKLTRVEYFQLQKVLKSQEKQPVIWDASTPKPVLDLLNEPTPLNAKAYIQWQEEKAERIKKAQEAISVASSEGKV